MKKIFVLCLCLIGLFSLSLTANAEFKREPVAFIVMDNTGEVTDSIFDDWKRQVKQAYRYPDYEFVDSLEPAHIAGEILAQEGQSTSKLGVATLRKIAEETQTKVVALVVVHRMEEIQLQMMGFGGFFGHWDDGPSDLVRVFAYADMYIYKADGDKMVKKIVRSVETDESPVVTPAVTVLKWDLRNLANKMENREQI